MTDDLHLVDALEADFDKDAVAYIAAAWEPMYQNPNNTAAATGLIEAVNEASRSFDVNDKHALAMAGYLHCLEEHSDLASIDARMVEVFDG